jgi:hypothetical protein
MILRNGLKIIIHLLVWRLFTLLILDIKNNPDFCGLVVYERWIKNGWDGESWIYNNLNTVKNAKFLFYRKWSDKEMYELARLGTLRIYPLKTKIKKLTK